MNIQINYDAEEDILYFYSGERIVDYSIDYDDIVLDVSGNKITGIEIMNASEKFANVDEEIEKLKQALNSIKEGYMKVNYGINSVSIKIGFVSSVPENVREGLLIQVPIKKEMMLEV